MLTPDARGALARALRSLPEPTRNAPAGSRTLRREIFRSWPAGIPHPTRADLVAGIRHTRTIGGDPR